MGPRNKSSGWVMPKHEKQTDISQAAGRKMRIHSLKSFQIKFSMNKHLGNCAVLPRPFT